MASGDFTLECKTLTGDQISIQATGGTLLSEVKARIAEEMEVDANCVKIMKGRKFLGKDTESLASYGIESDTKVKAIIRVGTVIPTEKLMEVDALIIGMSLSGNDRWAAAGTVSGQLYVFSIISGELIAKIADAHSKNLTSIAMTRNASKIITISWDRKVIVWDFDGSAVTKNHENLLPNCTGIRVCLTNDERHYITTGKGCEVMVWELASGDEVHTFMHDNSTYACCTTPNDQILVVGGESGALSVFDLPNKTQYIDRITENKKSIASIICSKDNSHCFVTCGERPILQYNLNDGTLVKEINIGCFFGNKGPLSLLKNDEFIIVASTFGGEVCMVKSDGSQEDVKIVDVGGECYSLGMAHMRSGFVVHPAKGGLKVQKLDEELFYGNL